MWTHRDFAYWIRGNMVLVLGPEDATLIADIIESELNSDKQLVGSSLPELADPDSPLLKSMYFKFTGDEELKIEYFRQRCRQLIIFGDTNG